ncbi:MAG TPA: hypothetical protein VEL47_00665 [Myxococcota bacterium]|nr:hypothetical protein [Myxococcota bacterium]
MGRVFEIVACVVAMSLALGCDDTLALAESSFGKLHSVRSKASPVSAISMGRDDDDGKAKKWHIGGSEK